MSGPVNPAGDWRVRRGCAGRASPAGGLRDHRAGGDGGCRVSRRRRKSQCNSTTADQNLRVAALVILLSTTTHEDGGSDPDVGDDGVLATDPLDRTWISLPIGARTDPGWTCPFRPQGQTTPLDRHTRES